MTSQSDFILKVLRDLQSRTEAAAKGLPGPRHMLVLSPGESIRVPPRIGCRAVEFSNQKQRFATYKFGETELVAFLPPRTSWPKGIEPHPFDNAERNAEVEHSRWKYPTWPNGKRLSSTLVCRRA